MKNIDQPDVGRIEMLGEFFFWKYNFQSNSALVDGEDGVYRRVAVHGPKCRYWTISIETNFEMSE